MMVGDRFTVHEALARGLAMARANSGRTLLAVGLLTLFGIRANESLGYSDLLFTLATAAIQYEVMRGALASLDRPFGFRFGKLFAYLGMTMLTLVPVVLGLVLLLIPGIYLAARWFLAAPILIAEDIGVVAALGASWEDTQRCSGTILALVLVIYLPAYMIAAVIEYFLAADLWLVRGVTTGLLLNSVHIFACQVAVALYAERIGDTGVAKVFE